MSSARAVWPVPTLPCKLSQHSRHASWQSALAIRAHPTQRRWVRIVPRCSSLDRNLFMEYNHPFAVALMNAPAEQLIKHQLQTLHETERYQELQFPFRPVVEANEPGAVVTQHPQDALRSALHPPIPIITGCNSGEGIMAYAKAKNHLGEYNDQPERLLPAWLHLPASVRSEVALQVKGFYFGREPVSRRTLVQLLDLLSDNEYVTATLTAAELMARHQPLVRHYAYYFTFDGRFGNLKQLLNLSHLPGVSHGDDVFYMFHSALNAALEADADEHRVRDALVTMWTDFARHGNPTPAESAKNLVTWEPVMPGADQDFHFRCLQIDGTFKMISNPTEKRSQFWRTLIRQYGYGSRRLSS